MSVLLERGSCMAHSTTMGKQFIKPPIKSLIHWHDACHFMMLENAEKVKWEDRILRGRTPGSKGSNRGFIQTYARLEKKQKTFDSSGFLVEET